MIKLAGLTILPYTRRTFEYQKSIKDHVPFTRGLYRSETLFMTNEKQFSNLFFKWWSRSIEQNQMNIIHLLDGDWVGILFVLSLFFQSVNFFFGTAAEGKDLRESPSKYEIRDRPLKCKWSSHIWEESSHIQREVVYPRYEPGLLIDLITSVMGKYQHSN